MEVWREIQQNVDDGARQLVSEYGNRLFAAASCLCRNDQDAEELVFRTFDQAVKKIRQYEPSGDFFCWLYTIMLNFRRMDLRRSGPDVVFMGSALDLPEQAAVAVLPDVVGEVGSDRLLAALRALPLHTGMLVGMGTLRANAAGYELERLEDAHYRAIHRAMEQALADGALGVSLGLGYAPECFCTTEELLRALAPLRGQNIPLTVHMRQEGAGVCTAVEEMLTVAQTLRIPLHISHLKAMGRDSWGKKIPRALALLEQARQEGQDVSCDVYPYTAGSTQLLHILPPEFLEGGMDAVVRRLRDPAARRELAQRIDTGDGFDDIARLAGWDGIYLTSLHCPEDHPFLGKSLAQIAALTGQDPLNCCCDLLVREDCQITMIDFMASEEDIAAILQSELSNLISDATYPTEGMPHPRVYGTFPRLIQHFVMEKHILTPEQAVRKMTALPAKALRLRSKGTIAVDMDADLCVFDPAQLRENGDYQHPCRMASGLDAVLVAGEAAVIHDTYTGAQAGTVIRRDTL